MGFSFMRHGAKRYVRYGACETLDSPQYKLSELRNIMDKMGVTQTLREAEGVNKHFRNAGDKIENFSRIQNFLMNLDRTGSIRTAAERSLKYQFDYSKLTSFERNVMGRLFPFYTFTKSNMAFQLPEVLRHPGPYMVLDQVRSRAQKENGSADPNSTPDYIRQGYNVSLGKDSKGNDRYLGGLGLSFESADKLGSAAFSKRAFEQNVISSGNPALKMAGELINKRNYFTGKDYDQTGSGDARYQQSSLAVMNAMFPNFVGLQRGTYTNQKGETTSRVTANPEAISIASSLPSSRFGTVASTAMNPDKTKADFVSSVFSPAKVYSVDPNYTAFNDNRRLPTSDPTVKKFFEQGVISIGSDGGMYVNKRYQGKDALETAKIRAQAEQAIKALNPKYQK